MYLCNFYFIFATFITTLHCHDPDDPLKSFGTAARNYGDVLEMSHAGIKKKTSLLDNGKLRSISKKLLALSKAAGPLVLFISTIFFEDVEATRHKEVMNEFKKLNDRFDRVEYKLDDQTRLLTYIIQDTQKTNYLSKLEATNGIYDVFVEKNSTFHFNQLKDRYQTNIDNVVGLEQMIGQYFETFMDLHGNFGALFDIYTNIVAKLSKLKLAFGVGCFDKCKNENDHSKDECTSLCFEDDQIHERITNILDTMMQKLQKCRSRNFAIHFVDRWMNKEIEGGSKTQLKNTISNFLAKKFSHWEYVLVVYPPHHGGHKHWTNYDIHRFRHYGHNIVLHFLPPSNSTACKDPKAPQKWCSGDYETDRRRGFYCRNKNDDAHEWYNRIKNHPDDFGHLSALTVFRGKDFTLKAHKACKKILNIESNEVCNRCPSRPTVPLTFIYA